MTQGARSRLRAAATRAEILWWTARGHWVAPALWISLYGWLGADPTPDWSHVAIFVASVTAAGAGLVLVNDAMDSGDDDTTTPYLPIPAGLITRRQCLVAAVIAEMLAVGLFVALRPTLTQSIVSVILLSIVILSGVAYSAFKDTGLLASFIVSAPAAVPTAIGWMLAADGDSEPGLLVLLVAYAFVSAVSSNVMAGLRDLDSDALVGNRTLAVRVGGTAAFRASALIGLIAFAIAVALWAIEGFEPIAAVFGIAAITFVVRGYRPVQASLSEAGRGRVQRMKDLQRYRWGEVLQNHMVIAVFQPLLAVILAVCLHLIFVWGEAAYERRIVRGGIARSLDPSPAAP